MRYSLGVLIFLIAGPASAAYRVYKFRVLHTDGKGKVSSQETVLSNLDPQQWASYHGTEPEQRLEPLDTWYCPGDTSGVRYCRKPKVSSRSPASTYPSRATLPYKRAPVIP